METLKWISALLHSSLARGPRWIIVIYVNVLSLFSRAIDNRALAVRLRARLFGFRWPAIKFRCRTVILGARTKVFLHPHLGEFDEEVLFFSRLSYEGESLRWLEGRAARDYDAIIEIGANVGLYTVFFDRLSRLPGARLKEIVSFEPSPEPYRRLLLNLEANGANKVAAYPVAIGDVNGFKTFFEPLGSLTNGSFNREFASLYSTTVLERSVMVFDAIGLKPLFERSEKVLLKIDVESYEPQLLEAIGSLIVQYRPDIVLEVLGNTADAIESCDCLANYERFLITDKGAERFDKFVPSERFRDWFLQPKNLSSAAG